MDQSTKTKQLQLLLVWYDKERLEIRVIKEMTGYEFGVFARKPLKEDDTVCRIARSAVLSAKNCGIANILEDAASITDTDTEDEDEDDMSISDRVALTLGVMFELSRGKSSPWYGYLQSLPHREPLPLFWSEASLNWLKGTELEESIVNDKLGIEHDYRTQVAPLVTKYPDLLKAEDYTLDQFIRVSSVVASRAFFVDDYHGDAMVPLADIFNHRSWDEHVHIESELDVCLVCGAAFGCEHAIDPEDPPFTSNGGIGEGLIEDGDEEDSDDYEEYEEQTTGGDDYDGEDEEDRLEMNVVNEARPGDEVYNTYGYHGNAHLLTRYGFAEDVNPCDVVSIPISMIREICERQATSPEALQKRFEFFATNMNQFQPENSDSDSEDSDSEEDEDEQQSKALPEYFGITFGGVPDLLFTSLIAMARMKDDAFAACQQSALHTTRGIDMLRPLIEDTLVLLTQGSGKRATPFIANLCRALREVARCRLTVYTPPDTTLEQDEQRRNQALNDVDRDTFNALTCRINEKRILLACIERCDKVIRRSTGVNSKKLNGTGNSHRQRTKGHGCKRR
ncbi:hypothetical protein BDF19DRAFT_451925 [Syncephalis fuscata]|nr:hypothetical protein BDF19DRAFT_451925 [Syncephalis fuscata]